jgi:hydrogenase maturation protease
MSDRTETTTQPPHVAVVGFGNILLKDEGVGVHIIQHLKDLLPQSARESLLIDGGTSPDVLLHLPKEVNTLIVVDAVKGGGKPGTIYRFTPADIEFKSAVIFTLHCLGLGEGLGMMKFLGLFPERVIIFGVEPKEIDWGLELSPELAQIVHPVSLLIKQEIACRARAV